MQVANAPVEGKLGTSLGSNQGLSAAEKDPYRVKDSTQEQLEGLEKLSELLNKLSKLPLEQQLSRVSEIQSKINSAAEGIIGQTGKALAQNVLPKELSDVALSSGGLNRKAIQAERAGVAPSTSTPLSGPASDGGALDFARPGLNQSIDNIALMKQELAGNPAAQELLDNMLARLKNMQDDLARTRWTEGGPDQHSDSLGNNSLWGESPEKKPKPGDQKDLGRRRRLQADVELSS